MSIFLVVDDSAVDRMMFKGLIERVSGFTVVEAENGMDAMEKIATWNPDVVVTDLQMPKMDGLDLVKQLRLDFPRIPVVLATGHGSQEIANQALVCGAAGYVPKAKLNDLLLPTLRNVLARKEHEAGIVKLMDRAKSASFHFVLESDRDEFPPLINLCKNAIEGIAKIDYIEILRIGTAIEQALHNALYRGNFEIPTSVAVPFGDEIPSDDLRGRLKELKSRPEILARRINVEVNVRPNEFVCSIRDEGRGFDPPSFEDSETTEDSGRGLMLMKTFVDTVEYNDRANQVTLRHNYDPKHPELIESNGQLVDPDAVIGSLTSMASGKMVELRKRKLLIGSSRSCHIALSGEGIAEHHCALIFKNDRWHVKDLGSAQGLKVNGEKTDRAKLNTGDLIQVGDRELKIEY